MKIDRYTKVVLTIIAVGIIGLNVHFFKDDFVKEAHAMVVGSHKHNYHQIFELDDRIRAIVSAICVSRGKGQQIDCM